MQSRPKLVRTPQQDDIQNQSLSMQNQFESDKKQFEDIAIYKNKENKEEFTVSY